MTDRTSPRVGDDTDSSDALDDAVVGDAAELSSRLVRQQIVLHDHEAQPLDERAAAYAVLHDTLTHTLEAGRPREDHQTESPRPHA